MRDKLKGTEHPFEQCVSQVATNNFIEAWADIAKDMSSMGNKDEAVVAAGAVKRAAASKAVRVSAIAAKQRKEASGRSKRPAAADTDDATACCAEKRPAAAAGRDCHPRCGAAQLAVAHAPVRAPAGLPGCDTLSCLAHVHLV